MKTVLFGMISAFLCLITVLICLSLYTDATRKNEMELALSQTVMSVFKASYAGDLSVPSPARVSDELNWLLAERISAGASFTVSLKVCDMERGILSVKVEETYETPLGNSKTKTYERTAIAVD